MNRSDRKKLTAIICIGIAVVILFALYFIILHLSDKGEDESDNTERLLIDINNSSSISAVYIIKQDASLGIYRHNGVWHFTSNYNLPVSDQSVRYLTDELQYIISLRTVTVSPDAQSYGLDPAAITIKLTVDGTEKTYLIGSYSSYYDGYYLSIGDGNIYITESSLYEAVNIEIEDLLGIDSLPDFSSCEALVLTDVNGESVSVEKGSKLYEAIVSMRIDRYIDHGADNYPVYRLDNRAVLTADEKYHIYLSVGETDEFVYVTIGTGEMIYTVSSDDLQTLVDAVKGIN